MDKEQFFQALQDGRRIECPTCERSAAYNPKMLNFGLCKSLQYLDGKTDWACPSRDLSHSKASAAALLRHWGLAESKVSVSKARGKDSGLWKITERGRAFVAGLITVPERILLYNGDMIGEPHGKEITFAEAEQRNYRDEE